MMILAKVRSVLGAAVMVAALLHGNAVGAAAAGGHPATNDLRQDATAVRRLPFVDTVDLDTATRSPDDPLAFGAAHTVWYVIHPARSARIEVSARGPWPSVSIVRRTRDGLRVIAQDVGDATGFIRIDRTFRGGTTTYVMVGDSELSATSPGDVTVSFTRLTPGGTDTTPPATSTIASQAPPAARVDLGPFIALDVAGWGILVAWWSRRRRRPDRIGSVPD